jgi:cellulose biosynthesis protein BcsQ
MSTNVIVTSIISDFIFKQKCLLTQTHFNYNNLEAPLVGTNSKSVDSKGYFLDVGLDTLVRNFKTEKLDKKTIENCCIAVENCNVSLLPGTTKINRDSFDYEIGMIAPKMFQEVEKYMDLVFIDASPSENELSMKLMENADLIVVNLSQNIGIMDLYFKQYFPRIKGKIFYLFGSYDANSKYNINNIRRRYKEITALNSGVIPYCTKLRDAQLDGKVVNFIRKNLNCNKNDENYYFISKSIRATEKMLKLARVRLKDKVEE